MPPPSNNFFYASAIFFIFVKKCKKNRLCPLFYEEVLEDIIKKWGPEAMPKFLIVMCIFATYCIAGHSLGALVYLTLKLSTAASSL